MNEAFPGDVPLLARTQRKHSWTALRSVGNAVGRVPLASWLTALMWAAAAGTRSVVSGPPPEVRPFVSESLAAGARVEWCAPVFSIFFTGNLASYILATVVILGGVGLGEVTMGTWRAALAFVVGHLAGLVLLLTVVGAGSALGSDWLASMKTAVVMGPYAGSLATAVAASSLLSPLLRRRLRYVTLAVTLMLLLYLGHPPALNAFLGVLAGSALGRIMHPPRAGASRVPRSAGRERRALLSMMVAVFAAGPAVAAVAQAPAGPLALLRDMIVNPVPTTGQLRANCRAAADLDCAHVMHSAGLGGAGGVALSLIPLLLLLVCAEGLRRGNRLALWVAVGVHLVIGVLSAFHLQMFSLFGTHLRTDGRVLPVESGIIEVLPVVLVPVVIAALLLVNRRHFIVDPDPVLRRRTLVLLPSLLAVFVLAYVIAWFAEENYRRKAGLLALLATLPRMFLPYPFSFRYSVSVHPHGLFSALIFSYGGAAFWLACIVSMFLLFLSRRFRNARTESDAATARELVRHGGTSLSWMALWPNNSYWFNCSRTAGVAYQVHNSVALTLGGPFGHPEDAESAAKEFTRYCAAQALTPCWYSVTDGTGDHLTGLGFRRVVVAEETLLPIRGLEFRGKEWQNIRTALNRARTLEISAQFFTYGSLNAGLRAQVHELSEAWACQKALPEMGFTLGGLEELKDDDVLLGLAVDRNGKVQAVTSWLPVFHEGRVVSRTLDVMRRGPQAFPGAMEFLIASAAIHFKDSLDVLSLSGSPLVRTVGSFPGPQGSVPGGEVMDRFLNLLGNALEPVYGFRSLAAFKARFRPRTRKLYLLYQDPLRLPSIGRALAHAYLPNISMRRTAKVLRQITS